MRYITLIFLAIVLQGCETAAKTQTTKPATFNSTPEVIEGNTGLSQHSHRYLTKVNMVVGLCTLQSNNHNQQRIITSTSPTIVMPNAITGAYEIVPVPEDQRDVFYNPNIPPFNMSGCVAEGTTGQWARFMKFFTGEVLGFAKAVVPYGAAYLVADKVFDAIDEPSVAVTGDNNQVAGPSGSFDNNPGVTGTEVRDMLGDQSNANAAETGAIIEALTDDGFPEGTTGTITTTITK